jgi:hypothetical protein
MKTDPITEQQVLEALREVPAARWGQVIKYLESLRSPPLSAADEDTSIRTLGDLLGSDLVGLWKDRMDISDSHEYSRALRRRASRRKKESNAP